MEPTGSSRLLLVEDDASLRSMSAETLRRAGFDVLAVASGREALEAIDERTVVVVLDWNVPEPRGTVLIEALQRACTRCGFVVVSGEPPESLPLAFTDSAIQMLRKPYRPYELVSVCLAIRGAHEDAGIDGDSATP